MLVPNKPPVQLLAVTVLIVFTSGSCLQNLSRRSVSEHQLMHDRSRTIQGLKRLIWLSGAMEGLHTAQTRSSFLAPPPPAQARASLLPSPPPIQARSSLLPPPMEALHTAQTRASLFPPPLLFNLGLVPAVVPVAGGGGGSKSARVESQHKVAVEMLMRDFFNPYLTQALEKQQ